MRKHVRFEPIAAAKLRVARQARLEGIDFRFSENLYAMFTEQGGCYTNPVMLSAGEAAIINEATAA